MKAQLTWHSISRVKNLIDLVKIKSVKWVTVSNSYGVGSLVLMKQWKGVFEWIFYGIFIYRFHNAKYMNTRHVESGNLCDLSAESTLSFFFLFKIIIICF